MVSHSEYTYEELRDKIKVECPPSGTLVSYNECYQCCMDLIPYGCWDAESVMEEITKLINKQLWGENDVIMALRSTNQLTMKIKAMHASKQQDWRTPPELLSWMEEQLGFKFTLDPCTSPDNPLGMERFYTEKEDGLKQSWKGHKVFFNPPYKNLPQWIKKAWEEAQDPNTVVVGLLPVRTSPKYMRKYVFTRFTIFLYRLRSRPTIPIGVHFLPKRVRFLDPATGKPVGSPYFDSMVVVWT